MSSDLFARRVKDADFKKMRIVPFSPYFKEDRDCPLFRKIDKVSADFMNNSGYVCYSRVEVVSDTRHSARCCGRPPLLRCNEVDVVARREVTAAILCN